MPTSDARARWRRPRPRNIRLIARCGPGDLERLLADGGAGDLGEHTVLEHGRLGRHLVVELPAWCGADDLAALLARLELDLDERALAVVRLERCWLLIQARAADDPTSHIVDDVDLGLERSGFPRGAATMPLRELEEPGVLVVALPGPLRPRRRRGR